VSEDHCSIPFLESSQSLPPPSHIPKEKSARADKQTTRRLPHVGTESGVARHILIRNSQSHCARHGGEAVSVRPAELPFLV
jgi:hypothetical protein